MNKKNKRLFSLEKKLHSLLANGVKNKVFTGAAAAVAFGKPRERKNYISTFGKVDLMQGSRGVDINTFFDLASLTKPFATTLAVLCLIKDKKIDINEKLSSLLRVNVGADKKNITLQQILSHSAGFKDHENYYEILEKKSEKQSYEDVIELIINEPLVYTPGTNNIYSDLGYILLGKIVEEKSGQFLDVYVREKIMKPLGLENGIFYCPLKNKSKKNKPGIFAATEDCSWRKKILRGEVHDDNCYAVGGVAGHAGLFGDITSVLKLTTFILDQLQGRAHHPNYNTSDIQYFLKRQTEVENSTWALGFDTPSKKESSGGKYITKESIGHLGFTGTSFWIDPYKELVMVLLSNRVHPQRDNIKIRNFRPLFHDEVLRNLLHETD